MKPFYILITFSIFLPLFGFSQSLAEIEAKRIMLPNGWGITAIGKSLPLGDLPLNMVVSPDKKLLAVTNNGQSTQSIQLIDIAKQTVSDTRETGIAWLGLAFSNDSKTLYASGGNGNFILRFNVVEGKLQIRDSIVLGKSWPEKISVAGIAVDDAQGLLYIVTKENNSLYVIDIAGKKIIRQVPLGGEGYTCILSPDKKTLFASCWGCDKVMVYDVQKQIIADSISVGSNPNDIVINRKGSVLYVANSNDNSVSVIDVKTKKVIETLNAALYPDAPTGSTTNGLALSEDEKTLYIANADNNCLAVFNITSPGNSKSRGFIPTGWYPTCVRVVGSNIFVSNGKGFSSLPDPKGPNPMKKKQKVQYQKGDTLKSDGEQYIASLFKGTLSIIPTPNEKQLGVYSQVVYHNTRYKKKNEMLATGMAGNPIPSKVGGSSPIKYVFYIIKENRTYDQVLGDMKGGNGDTSLVLFGKKVTPNEHALSKEFVLVDNFYCDGEVSADGHNWSTGAYATDYLEKTWPTSYGGRGGDYDAEGNRKIANNKNGFIWNYCKKYGVSYRTYAEFADDYKPNIPVLKNHVCPFYTGWDQSVMDTIRFGQWKRDFDSLLAIDKVPQLNTLRFINDHTQGTSLAKLSPIAQVADNDLAVGLFVDYLSKSKIWNESAVFIVEDDAQNGPDHVDAHRAPVWLAGGLVKRGFIDHTMYSTSSVLRTIELILGLPPMSQYDASAEPMWRCFSNVPNPKPFQVQGAQVDLFERNTAMNEWQRKSENFDFSKEDLVPDLELNRVIWFSVKGNLRSLPAPVHAAFIKLNNKKDED